MDGLGETGARCDEALQILEKEEEEEEKGNFEKAR